MLKNAAKYGVDFNTIDPSPELKGKVPLWKKTEINNTRECVCLRNRHGVHLVEDAMVILERLHDRTHVRVKDCTCEACVDDRLTKQCKNLDACVKAVEWKLSALLPKWDPRRCSPVNPRDAENEASGTFKPPTPVTSLTEGFRVLTRKLHPKIRTQSAAPTRHHSTPGTDQTVFIGTATARDGEGKVIAGGSIWYGPDNEKNVVLRVPEDQMQTARTADICSTLLAVQKAPRNQTLKIVNSKNTARIAMTRDLEKLEDRGWV
ncbi:hypothetical protein C8F04DRAFT_976179 [Mycena alexandri]|uniref:RNase H type-1 domain-containing protein n=1 Tax=Mycena alexandri TaxID=1745969 RepID=A0AAD6S130_9AGAR|nr:hypothetical protein C8F04DRAFT_976179 [Mycena alexandri]